MFSRLFVRARPSGVARHRIRASEQPGKVGICQHRFADSSNRGRMCPECGLPMLYVPGAAR